MNKLISLNKLSSKTKYTGQNCFGLTLYYAKIKPVKEPQLYFCLFNFMAVKHARPLLELAPNSQLSYKMFLSEICFNLPIISISAFYIVVFKESLFQAKEKENSPCGLKKNPETHFFTTVETDSPRMDDERYRVQTSSR